MAYWISWLLFRFPASTRQQHPGASLRQLSRRHRKPPRRRALLANYLADTVGPWLPASFGFIFSLAMMISCIVAIRRFSKS
jgi:hypothetical protein